MANLLSVAPREYLSLVRARLAVLLILQATTSAQAEQLFHLQPDNKYTVHISDTLKNGSFAQHLSILRGKRIVVDQSYGHFFVIDPFSKNPNDGIQNGAKPPMYDLNGDGISDLIIERWSGGVHGIYSFDIYSLSSPLKKLWSFDAGDGHMLTGQRAVSRHALPVLNIQDDTFRYWRTADFGFLSIPIKWDGIKFAADRKLMVAQEGVDDNWLRGEGAIKAGSKEDLQNRFVALYYAGCASDAKVLIPKIKAVDESVNDYHADFLKRLKSSKFYQDVLAINHGEL